MWKIAFSHHARKALSKLEPKLRATIEDRIANIKEWLNDEAPLHANVIRLTGKWASFCRLRVRDMRVLFSIDTENRMVRIHAIGKRDEIYR